MCQVASGRLLYSASHSNFIRIGVQCSKYCIVWSWWCIWSTWSLPLDNVTLHNTLCSSQATQNPFYLHVGSDILRSIEEHAKDRYTLVVCSVILVSSPQTVELLISFIAQAFYCQMKNFRLKVQHPSVHVLMMG